MLILCLGFSCVILSLAAVIVYHWSQCRGRIAPNQFAARLFLFLFKSSGVPFLFLYLALTWVLRLLPSTYYDIASGPKLLHVTAQLLSQDALQFVAHWAQHKQRAQCHRVHHRFTLPCLFDAFDGCAWDTLAMIIVPLYITAHLVPATASSYIVFGSIYASWLALIHAEYDHAWDFAFARFGFGTAAHHRLHHKVHTCNFGHLFTYWDRAAGTFRPSLAL